ncbi:uncharacterized protein [Procambarus clarkii]|uniref:uncharacterized protein isoform X1 n=2 Tax=Procambarus clarkii TaxID=6728 RepID=UPI003742D1E4
MLLALTNTCLTRTMARLEACLVTVVVTLVNLCYTLPSDNQTSSVGYQSGFLYVTPERRLKMPPASVLILTPTLSLPMDRNLGLGFGASMTTSFPFRIDFDTLGMTSEDNTWGINRKKREVPTPGDLAGGDREVMYRVVEKSMEALGVDGKACLLRAICELSQSPLTNHGFFGEVLQLFLSPSRSTSPTRHRLQEYTEAEQQGKSEDRCLHYFQACPYSFFSSVPEPSASSHTMNNGTSP